MRVPGGGGGAQIRALQELMSLGWCCRGMYGSYRDLWGCREGVWTPWGVSRDRGAYRRLRGVGVSWRPLRGVWSHGEALEGDWGGAKGPCRVL